MTLPHDLDSRPRCPGCDAEMAHPFDDRDHDCDCPWWCADCLARMRKRAA